MKAVDDDDDDGFETSTRQDWEVEIWGRMSDFSHL